MRKDSPMSHRCRTFAFRLILILSLSLPGYAFPPKRTASTSRVPARVTFDKSSVTLSPGQFTELKATILDKKDNEITTANVEWTFPRDAGWLELSRMDKSATKIVLHASESLSEARTVQLTAKS